MSACDPTKRPVIFTFDDWHELNTVRTPSAAKSTLFIFNAGFIRNTNITIFSKPSRSLLRIVPLNAFTIVLLGALSLSVLLRGERALLHGALRAGLLLPLLLSHSSDSAPLAALAEDADDLDDLDDDDDDDDDDDAADESLEAELLSS